ncbi:MAG: hypothetical protein H7A35_15220 [Planctomycetales bacterium]|nr:hypothetical protein [bacterium]UNM08181.1 MAG: hypothetical protein H7A35_15220 [Planctomycetales bacterium]
MKTDDLQIPAAAAKLIRNQGRVTQVILTMMEYQVQEYGTAIVRVNAMKAVLQSRNLMNKSMAVTKSSLTEMVLTRSDLVRLFVDKSGNVHFTRLNDLLPGKFVSLSRLQKGIGLESYNLTTPPYPAPEFYQVVSKQPVFLRKSGTEEEMRIGTHQPTPREPRKYRIRLNDSSAPVRKEYVQIRIEESKKDNQPVKGQVRRRKEARIPKRWADKKLTTELEREIIERNTRYREKLRKLRLLHDPRKRGKHDAWHSAILNGIGGKFKL